MIDFPQKDSNIIVDNSSVAEIQEMQVNQISKPGQPKSNGSIYSLKPPSIDDDIKNLLSQLNPVIVEELAQRDSDLETYYYSLAN